MAEVGEGEDEIQFLRTVSTTSFPSHWCKGFGVRGCGETWWVWGVPGERIHLQGLCAAPSPAPRREKGGLWVVATWGGVSTCPPPRSPRHLRVSIS